jgi:glycosyltransferase involved in cell wall biosynthesis
MIASRSAETCAVSVVIPFYNEEDNVRAVLEEVDRVAQSWKRSYEIVAVDDGSTDGTRRELARAVGGAAAVRVLRSAKNQGQSAAFLAGFRAARGEIIVTMDGDGQNPPEEIARLLAGLDKADMVVGWRAERRDSPLRRGLSQCANFLRRLVTADRVHDTGCSLKAFRREVAESFVPFRGAHRFLPALAVQSGWRVAEVPVTHRPRTRGATKYSFRNRGLRTCTDLWGVWWLGRRRLNVTGYVESVPGEGSR